MGAATAGPHHPDRRIPARCPLVLGKLTAHVRQPARKPGARRSKKGTINGPIDRVQDLATIVGDHHRGRARLLEQSSPAEIRHGPSDPVLDQSHARTVSQRPSLGIQAELVRHEIDHRRNLMELAVSDRSEDIAEQPIDRREARFHPVCVTTGIEATAVGDSHTSRLRSLRPRCMLAAPAGL